MTIGALIDGLHDRDHSVTVYARGERPPIEPWLAARGVPVERRTLPPGGPAPFLELETGGAVVGVVGVDALEGLLAPPIDRPGDRTGVSPEYQVLFELFEETVLTTMERRELLAVSREIEDRAYRVGAGTLRVSFQSLSTFRAQTDVYRTLGAETDLDVHIYGVEDWTPPSIPGVTYHADVAAQFEPYWVLAFDGGADPVQACGLAAEERADGYRGFWTDDPGTVESIAAAFDPA